MRTWATRSVTSATRLIDSISPATSTIADVVCSAGMSWRNRGELGVEQARGGPAPGAGDAQHAVARRERELDAARAHQRLRDLRQRAGRG
jgi:hypothetical protein